MADITEQERKIIKQIEYYFSDENLRRDKFLQIEIGKDDGWVTLELLTRFNMLKRLSTDYEEICKALEKSESKLVEVHEKRDKVRRLQDKPVVKLTREQLQEQKLRSVFVKGFSPENTPMDKLQDYFEAYGPVTTIIKRFWFDEDKKKHFKGSVFAVYEKKEDGEKYLADEGNMKFGEVQLVRKCWQVEHDKEKEKEKKEMYLAEKKQEQNGTGVAVEDSG